MSWIQYAANFEDVMIRRVFHDLHDGCYVDIGAHHPVSCSNTYALYERGWRGIAIEPQPAFADAWSEWRPEDVFINAMAGEAAGEAELYVVAEGSQNATRRADLAERYRDARFTVGANRVPVVPINAVLDEHRAGRELHLLSLDVEGAEREVLRALDFARHRPWLMVVEATVPGTPEPAHEAWEGIVLEAGYQLAYFDGLNRFYLAAEHQALKDCFALPPNVWDDFVPWDQARLQQALAQERARNEELEAWLKDLESDPDGRI